MVENPGYIPCDNLSVVQALSVRDSELMHLLFFFEAYFQFDHVACHIPGLVNNAADALSQDSIQGFLFQANRHCPN